MPSTVRRLALALLVAGVGLAPAPAAAAGFCTHGGVSVVVDFGALGGGVRTGCDATGNRNAAKAFANTGHPLTYAQRQPGFVCRVDGVPSSDPCVNTSPADAYWGLYWSDGTSGWKYSTLGVGSLEVPAGGTVAFSWQDGGTADPPGTGPASAASASPTSPAASSTPTPRTSPTRKPKPAAGSGASTPTTSSGTPTGSTPTTTPSGPTRPTGTTSSTATESSLAPEAAAADGVTSEAPAGTTEQGLPWWVPALVGVLLGGAAITARSVRRARGPR